ncbi:uncharacterized protein N0V89_006484 [Didymosphaeria variabile]|uniref:RRM domain-containing protein n=1 Tax=Didymosphaeria variabile TaxID=1932322 RepID=A0A9W9C9A1_9PLEO|nr:uncharacterized protein N0V89_006484 [Didymosphaeria variabile]KAJ4351145.1 hypothetical protein N0V89_006484 [Didymosphaeria variabile]
MFNDQPRKTSIPIHFHFAHSKRVVPALKDATRAVSTPLRSKKRPASILVPQDTPDHRRLPTAVQPQWTTVEISNFAPRTRKSDVLNLLGGYDISPPVEFPATPRFTRPFRVTVMVSGVEEARRMVKELNGTQVGGRNISVRMTNMTEEERMEYQIQDMADQIKTGIINTAHVYHPDLADSILEVRELVQDENHCAFLQKRTPVTVHSSPKAHALETQNKAKWELVAASAAGLETGDSKVILRLEALKGLQDSLETQGVLEKIWDEWSGSSLLAEDVS